VLNTSNAVYVSPSVSVLPFVNTFVSELVVECLVTCGPLTFPLYFYLITINFHCLRFVLVDSGDQSSDRSRSCLVLTIVDAATRRGHFNIVLMLRMRIVCWIFYRIMDGRHEVLPQWLWDYGTYLA
jgi:hypothetical protein